MNNLIKNILYESGPINLLHNFFDNKKKRSLLFVVWFDKVRNRKLIREVERK